MRVKHNQETWAVALGYWEGKETLAIRWNGDDENPVGTPQSRGLPTWFILPNTPEELRTLKKIIDDRLEEIC
jgi:hypothetical protein